MYPAATDIISFSTPHKFEARFEVPVVEPIRSDADARAEAHRIWKEINEVNLYENILHTRDRATLILEKGSDHGVERVRLRRR